MLLFSDLLNIFEWYRIIRSSILFFNKETSIQSNSMRSWCNSFFHPFVLKKFPVHWTGKNCLKSIGVTNKRIFFSTSDVQIAFFWLQRKQNKQTSTQQKINFFTTFFCNRLTNGFNKMRGRFFKKETSSNDNLADVKRVVCPRQGLTTNLSGSG